MHLIYCFFVDLITLFAISKNDFRKTPINMEKGIMLKKVLFSICALYFIFANSANALAVSTYYFESSTNQEVRIDVWGSSSDPQFLFYNDTDLDSNELFRQYVAAGLNRQIYVYVEDTCGSNCNNNFEEGDNKNIQAAGRVMHNKDLQGAVIRDVNAYAGKQKANVGGGSAAIKLIDGALNQLGSRSVDLIVNKLTSNNTVKSSPYTIFSISGFPFAMCRMVEGACDMIDDVEFGAEGDGWKAIFPAPEMGVPDAAHRQNIYNTMVSYVITVSVACKTVYTGISGSQTAHMMCWDPQ